MGFLLTDIHTFTIFFIFVSKIIAPPNKQNANYLDCTATVVGLAYRKKKGPRKRHFKVFNIFSNMQFNFLLPFYGESMSAISSHYKNNLLIFCYHVRVQQATP